MRQIAEEVLFFPQRPPDLARVTQALAGVDEQLGILQSAMRAPFVGGDAPGAADFAFYPLVAFLRRIDERRRDVGAMSCVRPSTLAWMKRVEALPYYERTVPPHWRPNSRT